jgi:hypothetical protein
MNTRIWFTGSQGSGKTTQRDHFKNLHPQFNIVGSDRRKLLEDGIIKVNREAEPWSEVVMGGDVLRYILSTPAPSISDRSWICKIAYSQLLPYPDEVLEAMHTYYTYAFPGFTKDDVYVYFPPTLVLENDGVRDTDEEYQYWVDYFIQFYLNYFEIPYLVLTAKSIQDRYLMICDYLKVRKLEY